MSTQEPTLANLLRKSGQMVTGFVDVEDKRREAGRAEPEKWVHDELHMECQGIQGPVMRALAEGKDCAVRTGHSCGKSGLAGMVNIWWLDTRPMSKVMSTAPGERQLKHILWAEIGARFANWSRRHEWQLTRGMNMYNKVHPAGWFGLGVYSSEADKIEGFHTETPGYLLIIVDEAKAVDDTFFVACASMVGQRLMTSVPALNSRGFFYDAFSKHKGLWECFHMSTLNSPFVTQAWIEDRKKDWIEGSAVWQAKILGDFPKNISSNLLINPSQVEDAQKRWEDGPGTWTDSISVGVDVARFGDDRTVVTNLINSRLVRIIEKAKQDTMATVGIIIENLRQIEQSAEKRKIEVSSKKIPVVVDDTGLGGGVVDRLGELEYNVVPINFAWKAEDPEKYANKRTELWCNMALAMDWLVLPSDDAMMGGGARLAAELTSTQFAYTSTGKKLEPKESIKKRTGVSPDIGDSLALAIEGVNISGNVSFGCEVF